ncbi:carbohydrate ABC transporter permease [Archangium sp.]|uniref:carbohydrate ABC transporter permease n=1 Tax=Archangium sp. TaxID=1872627 RepID=UPI00286D2A28|nr:carbohydrate ABC transporter permease [Archangium sp.]
MLRLVKRILFGLLVLGILGYTLFPFYWAIVSSLKTGSALFEVEFWPKEPAWGNYPAVFRQGPFGQNLLNSVVVSLSTVLLSLGLAVTASFSLARIQFRGRKALLLTILSVSMFPQVSVLTGMFELIRWLGLYNRLPAMIVSYMLMTLPFTIWILTTFMRELPVELEEAAIMDGASPWVVVSRVFLPLLGPSLATTGLLAFIAAWNEFIFALTFTLSDETRTVPVAIALLGGNTEFELPWGLVMAASVIVTVPLIVLVLIFQRRIVAGLTAGAVKG